MDYQIASTDGTAKEMIRRVIQSKESQLLLPPAYSDLDPLIEKPREDLKMVGLFSSGTTGQPKCIWNSYEHLKQNAMYSAEAFGIPTSSRLLMLAAPWHVAGLSWAIMAEESDLEYEFISTVKGEQNKWHEVITGFRPTHLLTVPAVLHSLYSFEWKVPTIIYGGSMMKYGELSILENYCQRIIQGYGQTEAGGLVATHSRLSHIKAAPDEHLCCGQPIEGVKLVCNGQASSPDIIYIKSETAYTESMYDSGDEGYMDTEGNIYVTGRRGM